MNQIILDPVTILGMSTYYEKKIPRKLGATIGLLYAQQVELKYRICVSAPIGVNSDSTQDLVSRMLQYEGLRLKRSKNTVNFYEEYHLVGWYLMGTSKYAKPQDKKNDQISKQLMKRNVPYFLIVDADGSAHPKLFHEGNPCPYTTEMQPTQKICIDSMYMQTSKDMSTLQKTIEKTKNVIQVFSEKIEKLRQLLKTDISAEKRRKIMEIIDNYERIEYQNKKTKSKTIEAMNYSILSGIVLDRTVKG